MPLSGFDVAMLAVDAPTVFNIDTNYLTVRFGNVKADSIYWLDLGYQVDNNPPVLISNYFMNGDTLSPGETHSYQFATPIILTTKGNYMLKTWVANANDSIPDNNKNNDTLFWNFCTGMAGGYTIGSAGDYPTFNAAYAALQNCGIAGPVTFNVKAGTYSENLILTTVQGMSEVNTVTFKGISKTGVTLSSSASAVVDFNGAAYFQFKDMTVNASGYTAFWYHADAHHNLVDNCIVNGNTTTNSSAYNVFNGSSTVSSYSGYGINGNYNVISNNEINGGYCGINWNGSGTTSVCVGNEFIGNTLKSQSYYGIRQYYMGRSNVAFNKISNMRDINGYGYYSYYGTGNKVNGNMISAGTWGIRQHYENYYVSDSSYVTNNMVYDFTNPNNQCGTYFYYNYNTHILNNTIRVSGTLNSYSYPAMFFYYYLNGSIIRNNILISTDASYLISIYYTYSGVDIDQNLYIYPKTTGYNYFYCYTPAMDFKNFATFQPYTFAYLGTHDENSLDNVDPHFASSTDLHLSNTYPPIKLENAGLMYDVDMDLRCPYETAIGADEPNFPVPKPTSKFVSEDTLCFGTPITFVNVAGPDAKQGYWWYQNGKFKSNDRNFVTTFGVGTYQDTITLITENCGGRDTFTKIITVDSPKSAPMADFVSDLNLVETAYPVQFYDISTNCPDTWEWFVYPDSVNVPLFGKMASASYLAPTHPGSQNPYISFEFPGTYDIRLITSNSKGKDTIYKYDYVVVKPSQWMCLWAPPTASASLFGILYDDGGPISDYQPNMNCDITLEPCASELTFEFSEFNVQAGDYFRIYEGTDNAGRKLWNETNYPAGVTGQFTDANFQSTYTSNNGQLFIEWITNASAQSAGFIGEWYGVAANYAAPTAMFDAPDTVCLGMPVNFENKSIGDKLLYSWDFSNGGWTESVEENPTYTYNFWPGTYTVSLTVENCGGSSIYTKKIVVIQPSGSPTADFEADSRKPVAGDDFVRFTDLSTGNAGNPYGCVNEWEWTIDPDTMMDALGIWVKSHTFVGGTTKFSQNPIIRFEDTGYYTISMKAGFNTNGSTETKVDYIYAIKYCQSTVTNLNPDIGISRVQLASIDNTTPIGKASYTNYSNEQSTFLDMEGGYTVTIERKSTYNAMNRKVWIDWNIDGDFEDAGELIGSEASANTLTWDQSFTVPLTAAVGPTRMRVAANLGNMSNDPCGTRAYGEIEDYRVIIRPDGTPPVITLDTLPGGGTTVYLEQCDCRTYVDAGASAWDNINGPVPATYVGDNIDCQNYGTYYYRYTAQDSIGNVAFEDRIIVVNMEKIAPEITLLGKLVDTLNFLQTYTEAGWNAFDTCSGLNNVDITGIVVNTSVLGDYELIYTAFDKNGNSVSASRMVYVRDLEDPVISLRGYSTLDIEVHNPYVEDGVDLSDNYCTKLTADVTGSVDIHTLGMYTLTYSVTDCNGNGPVSVQRVVNVIDTTAPVISVKMPHYNGETFTVEVGDVFYAPLMNVTDNYNKLSEMNPVFGGTYITEFGVNGVTNKLGSFTYTYTVIDESGNSSYIEYTINVVDTEAPVISLEGNYVINLCRFDKIDEDNYTIKDNYDLNLTLDVPKDGSYYKDYEVNMYWGFYTIIYNATDNSGNKAKQVVRYVNVQECSWYGMEENDLSQLVKVYPNPTRGEFMVAIDLPQSENIVIRVTNMLGEEIDLLSENSSKGGVFKLNLGDYSDGVYFVQVKTDNSSTVQKITLSK
ncbi:immunoglobulin-like domain-containing protein [Bacteroidota bacterium]